MFEKYKREIGSVKAEEQFVQDTVQKMMQATGAEPERSGASTVSAQPDDILNHPYINPSVPAARKKSFDRMRVFRAAAGAAAFVFAMTALYFIVPKNRWQAAGDPLDTTIADGYPEISDTTEESTHVTDESLFETSASTVSDTTCITSLTDTTVSAGTTNTISTTRTTGVSEPHSSDSRAYNKVDEGFEAYSCILDIYTYINDNTNSDFNNWISFYEGDGYAYCVLQFSTYCAYVVFEDYRNGTISLIIHNSPELGSGMNQVRQKTLDTSASLVRLKQKVKKTFKASERDYQIYIKNGRFDDKKIFGDFYTYDILKKNFHSYSFSYIAGFARHSPDMYDAAYLKKGLDIIYSFDWMKAKVTPNVSVNHSDYQFRVMLTNWDSIFFHLRENNGRYYLTAGYYLAENELEYSIPRDKYMFLKEWMDSQVRYED